MSYIPTGFRELARRKFLQICKGNEAHQKSTNNQHDNDHCYINCNFTFPFDVIAIASAHARRYANQTHRRNGH